MIKRIQNIFFCVLSVLLSLVLLLPNFNSFNVFAEQANEEIKHSLISPFFNSEPTKTKEKYNIDQTSPFTPFNFDEEKREEGMSFRLTVGEKNKIENQFVYVDDYDVEQGQNYSLYLWIYFDSAYVHDLTISLNLENGSIIKWEINYFDLQNLLRKTSELNYIDNPFAWNKLELPFECAEVSGEIFNQNKLVQTEKMVVNFSSNRNLTYIDNGQEKEKSVATLRFYDVYLGKSVKSEVNRADEQNHRIFAFNFFEDDFVNSVCVGDQAYIPTFSNAVKYAWNGEIDVKNDMDSTNSIVWSVVIQTPNLNNEYIKNISFGQKITFEYEGTYRIFYQCVDTRYSTTEPIISGSKKIVVSTLNPIYFDRSYFNFKVGKSYIVKAQTSSKFSEVSDFQYVSSSENVLVEDLGGGYFKITPNKKGKYSIDVSVDGKRVASPDNKNYKVTIDISVDEEKKDNTQIYKIVLWCIAGLGVVILLIIGIKIIVKAHKYDVK